MQKDQLQVGHTIHPSGGVVCLLFQCRLFGDTPYLAARARRRGGRPKAEYRENEIGEAPPSRLERVGSV